MTKNIPQIILQAARHFADADTCCQMVHKARWPDDKPVCPYCGSLSIVSITTRKVLRCKTCRKQFSLKQGTIFENSPLELGQWLLGIFAVINYREITCQQLADLLGVTLFTAWKMRKKLKTTLNPLTETYYFQDALSQIYKKNH